jgi:hypothetical protein
LLEVLRRKRPIKVGAELKKRRTISAPWLEQETFLLYRILANPSKVKMVAEKDDIIYWFAISLLKISSVSVT